MLLSSHLYRLNLALNKLKSVVLCSEGLALSVEWLATVYLLALSGSLTSSCYVLMLLQLEEALLWKISQM